MLQEFWFPYRPLAQGTLLNEWGGGGAGRKEYMSHKQGKGLQDAIFWTCSRNLPTTAYDCTGSVKKKWAHQQPSMDGGGDQGALYLTVDLLLRIARFKERATLPSVVYILMPLNPPPLFQWIVPMQG